MGEGCVEKLDGVEGVVWLCESGESSNGEVGL